ncbi:MAG: L-threonylcarbamoyladenylate synthase [bacterium]|nr:L-threonylcarbamoyladenylate synthase [bacterium]
MQSITNLNLDPLFGIATDTLWGLACRAADRKSVARIFELKKRDGQKPLILFTRDIHQARDLIKISKPVEKLLNKWWPGPISIIGEPTDCTYAHCYPGSNYLGVRIPNHTIALELLEIINEPIAVTSFNISGQPNLSDIEELKTLFPEDVRQFYGSMPSIYAASIVAQQIGENELKLLRYTNEQLKQLKEDCERIGHIVIQT